MDEDELVALLIAGASSEALGLDDDPLSFAVRHLMPRLTAALLAAGANANATSSTGQPLIHEVIRLWETGRHGWAGQAVPMVLDSLLESGADPNSRGDNDFTPLHVAAAHANESICERLLKAGADPLAVAEPHDDEGGRTPYELAEFHGRLAIAAMIRSRATAEQLDQRIAVKNAARNVWRHRTRTQSSREGS